MTEAKHLKVSVDNFGPIKKGEFDLKPLTIFVGPNNSGKSYMALLTYVLVQVLSARARSPFSSASNVKSYPVSQYGPLHSLEVNSELEAWLMKTVPTKATIAFEDLPSQIQRSVREDTETFYATLSKDLEHAFSDYFGSRNISALIGSNGSRRPLSVRLNVNEEHEAFLSINLEPDQQQASISWAAPDIDALRISRADVMRAPYPEWFASEMVRAFWSRLLEANGVPRQGAYYLPSARSGILQGWQLLTTLAVEAVRRGVGLERTGVGSFTGVAGDFLTLLLGIFASPQRTPSNELQPALEILEGQVFNGTVSLEPSESTQPLLLYSAENVRVPLQRASSMVAELAPLDLWLKYLLVPGDVLIIDEPEAHLHPENQRRIARVLVRLVRAGVKVICPTHSSLILHQITNHLLATQADADSREALGFTGDDLITGDEIGVYLFDLQSDGATVSSVPIDSTFGISEEEFVKVAEAIGEETYRLSLVSTGDSTDLP